MSNKRSYIPARYRDKLPVEPGPDRFNPMARPVHTPAGLFSTVIAAQRYFGIACNITIEKKLRNRKMPDWGYL